jgi:hypothetical protein
MILIEMVGAIDAAGTVRTFFLSDSSFCTAPTDTPPNTAFSQVLLDPGSIGVHAYSDGRTTGGAAKLETGEVVVINVDGQFDGWLDFAFDGRPITIRQGEGDVYPADFPVIFNGTVESIEANKDSIIIRLRDKLYVLTVPILKNRYAGTNVLPNGLEGGPDDIKGKLKSGVWGAVLNMAPVLVNASKLTYQVNDGAVADVSAVYDRAASVTKGANYATSALLQAATPGAGTYATCFAEGLFRLGTSPSGQITADVTEGANAAARTAGQILKRMAIATGLPAGEINAADLAALDALNSSVVGIVIDGDSTGQAAMDLVAASVGAWYGFDGLGMLRMGVLAAPTGTPVLELFEFDIGADIERRPARDNGIPAWRVVVNYARNWTVQNSDIAGVVMPARRSFLGLANRSANSANPAVKVKYLLSDELAVDTLLATAADAQTEADRLEALYGVRRDIFDVPVDARLLQKSPLFFMDAVRVTYSRFGLDAGKLFRVIGIRPELKDQKVTLSLWG